MDLETEGEKSDRESKISWDTTYKCNLRKNLSNEHSEQTL